MARAFGHRHLNQFYANDLTTGKKEMADLTGVQCAGVGQLHRPVQVAEEKGAGVRMNARIGAEPLRSRPPDEMIGEQADARLMNPIMKGLFKKGLEKHVDALKAYCER